MTKTPAVAPENCADMPELRAQIDRVDEALVALLVERAGYIDRAIDIKSRKALPARITPRVNEVLSRVRAAAEVRGFDADLAERLWRELIEWSIAREEAVLGPDPEELVKKG